MTRKPSCATCVYYDPFPDRPFGYCERATQKGSLMRVAFCEQLTVMPDHGCNEWTKK